MKIQLVVAISCFVAACAPKVDNKGYVKQTDLLSSIVAGQTSKQEIVDLFGSPSSQSSFGAETWYYIGSRKETVGFLKPEQVDQDITRIEFDAGGVVSKVERYTQDNASDIQHVNRETPTEGHSLGFVEQVMGNVGRFNKPGSRSDTVAPGRRPGGGY